MSDTETNEVCEGLTKHVLLAVNAQLKAENTELKKQVISLKETEPPSFLRQMCTGVRIMAHLSVFALCICGLTKK